MQPTEMRKAQPAVRRTVILVLVSAGVGALLIAAFERYHPALRGWILSEPAAAAQRGRLVLLLIGALLTLPMLAFAAYLWSLGVGIARAREYPPPGFHVRRETPVVVGERAIARSRLVKALALGCAAAAAALGLLLWRIASILGDRVF